jgi:uncharacterized protein (DUF342 family)
METSDLEVKEIPKIIGKGRDHWKVLIRLSFAELLDNRKLLTKLSQLKKYISETEEVPLSLLNYEGIIERRQTETEMFVTVRIVRLPIEKGEPTVRFQEKLARDGTPYSDMKAVLDLYPFDSFEQMITFKKVLIAIEQSGIPEDMFNPLLVRQKVRQVTETMLCLKNIPIAVGSLPEIGKDAEVEFFFPAVLSEDNSSEYYSSRRVKTGDIICRKIPPTEGKTPGTNVKGKMIPPRKGMDIELKTQKGVSLNLDGLQAIADNDGMVVVKWVETEKRLPQGRKVIPTEVQVKVNSVLKIKEEEVVDITTNKAVEIEGNLKIGSRIITDGEVHIAGSVEEGAVVRSLDDITVEGNVTKADLSSDMNVIANGSVSGSKIVAKNDVIVGGEIRHTRVVGRNISAKRISSSNIMAQQKLSVDYLDDDESNVVSSIAIGVQEFLRSRYEENQEFLEHAQVNLQKIVEVIGEPFSSEVTHSNIQQQWVHFCAQARCQKKKYTRHQMNDLKTLFQNIPTLKALVQEKQTENEKIEQRMQESGDEETMIIVREKVGKRIEVKMNGVSKEMEASSKGAKVENKGDE